MVGAAAYLGAATLDSIIGSGFDLLSERQEFAPADVRTSAAGNLLFEAVLSASLVGRGVGTVGRAGLRALNVADDVLRGLRSGALRFRSPLRFNDEALSLSRLNSNPVDLLRLQNPLVRNADDTIVDANGYLRATDGRFASTGVEGSQLHRPSLRAPTIRQIEANARKNNAGQFIDDNNRVIDTPQYGHIRGSENRRIIAAADELGLTQRQLNDYVNARPQHFQIEEKSINLSHVNELPGNDQLDSLLRDMTRFFELD